VAEEKVSDILDSLCNDDISLSALLNHEDSLLIYMTRTVDEIYYKMVNFRPEIDLQDSQIAMNFRESTQAKLQKTLSEACEIKHEPLIENN
jgi:hypothetical protein